MGFSESWVVINGQFPIPLFSSSVEAWLLASPTQHQLNQISQPSNGKKIKTDKTSQISGLKASCIANSINI
jgi:hypothetical protein